MFGLKIAEDHPTSQKFSLLTVHLKKTAGSNSRTESPDQSKDTINHRLTCLPFVLL